MKKEKFMISARKCDDDGKFLQPIKIEVDGWTYKGLGYYRNNSELKEYNVTHLVSGYALYYAKTKHEAETFIRTITIGIDCTLGADDLMKEFIKKRYIFDTARELATAV